MSGLNWRDPAAVHAWLDDVAARVEDLVDVARDQTRANRKRYFGRATARNLLREAKRALRSQLAHARNGVAKRGSVVAHLRLVPPPSDSTPA